MSEDDLFDKILQVKGTLGAYFKATRYAIILLAATTLKNFKEYRVIMYSPLDGYDHTCYNLYRLTKVAAYLDLPYDRSKQAKKIYEELEQMGEVKSFIQGNKTYVSLTERGRRECLDRLEELRKLQDYRYAVKSATHVSRMTVNNAKEFEKHIIRNPSFKEIRIMCVDDDPDVTIAFRRAFEEAGFKVDGFTDPLLALAAYKANHYDILILDVRMPGMDGLELYEKLTSINKNVNVFFVTAFEVYYEALKEIFSDSDLTHFTHFIRKPIDIPDLVYTIKTVLNID